MNKRAKDARRFRVLRILILCAGVVLAGRLVHIQIFLHDKYRAIALDQWKSTVAIPAERGNLYDHTGRPLALSATTYRIGVSGSLVKDTNSLAVLLADVLEGDRARIRKKIAGAGDGHVVLASDVVLTSRQVSRIKADGQLAVTM